MIVNWRLNDWRTTKSPIFWHIARPRAHLVPITRQKNEQSAATAFDTLVNGRVKIVQVLNPRLLALGLSLLLGTASALAQVLTSLEGSYILPAGDPAIRYRELGQMNAIARLQEQLAAGTLRLPYDRTSGYLPAILKALDVP